MTPTNGSRGEVLLSSPTCKELVTVTPVSEPVSTSRINEKWFDSKE